jgi:hypothetical protein
MTTEELIAACTEAGETVSVTQLARWVRAGLIPAHLRQRRSRGRGKGIEWRWQPECINRAIIIARTVQVGEGSDPSLQRAALSLALLGYDLGAQPLRDLLIRGVTEFGLSLQQRQPFLRDGGVSDAPQRIRRRFRRQFPIAPDSTIQALTAIEISMHGLPRNSAPQIRADDADVLSLPRLREGLLAADETTLLTAYAQAKLFAPMFGKLEALLMMIQEALLAAAPTFGRRIEARLLDALPPEARIALMRLILTAVLAAHPELLRADSGELQERTQSLFHVMTDILPGSGLSQYEDVWQKDDASAEAAEGKESPMV